MKWTIPAKTFLLGEYSALRQSSAILLITSPCFQLQLNHTEQATTIHPDSPAGLYWRQKHYLLSKISWIDPYHGQGGLGASSAQFLGVYLADCYLNNTSPTLSNMLSAYHQYAWTGEGLKPSGYDILAQTQFGCTYINKQNNIMQSYPWPFSDLGFLLIHTGMKLATHHHLQNTTLPSNLEPLSLIVEKVKEAFDDKNSECFIHAINEFHDMLKKLQRVAPHTLSLIEQLRLYPELLAVKGCGALGADILLLITYSHSLSTLQKKLIAQGFNVIATQNNLIQPDDALLANKIIK